MGFDQMDDTNIQTIENAGNLLNGPVKKLIEDTISDRLDGEIWVTETRAALRQEDRPKETGEIKLIINRHRVNDIRYINKFLESVNQNLPLGGFFVGSVEVAHRRKERIMLKYPKLLNTAIYSVDYLVRRVWPKLPYLRKSYFALTRGRNRVIAEMEMYGRLYACGFKLLDTLEADGRLYFAAEKTGEPDYNMEATYGPLIKLRRITKGGKIIKVYKFRTMSPYSEYIQAFIYERNGYDGGAKFRDDYRVTTLGAFMRKYWIDELPMLINLIRGDVKTFGIRPVSAHYLTLFSKEFQEYRKKFKPGLIPPVYVEVPQTFEEIEEIERRYMEAYEKQPLLTDIRYISRAFYNIFIKKVRSQ